LIYALYPVTGKRFLKWKYGKEQPPAEVNPRTLQDVQAEQELIKKAKAGLLFEKKKQSAPAKSDHSRTFNVFVDNEYFEVAVDEIGGSPVISYVQPMTMGTQRAPMAAPPAAPAPKQPEANKETKPEAPAASPAAAAEAAAGTPVTAPMPGMIVNYEKNVGDSVSLGETVVILEAMKMENALPAPASGTIKSINFSSGDSVAKGDVLAIIG
jgi:pyruvate carboxylase subunit B